MSGEMIAIITAAIALAAVLVPGQRAIRRDIRKDIQQLSTRIGGLEGRADATDKRFDAIDVRLDAIDERLGAVEREVADVRTEVARGETRLTSCIGKLEAELKERLARLEGYFEAMGIAERPTRKRTAN
jgi:septal ring factor EnvC (AmiA/AmiB activator)